MMQIIQILVLFNVFLALCCNSVNGMLKYDNDIIIKDEVNVEIKDEVNVKSFVKDAIDEMTLGNTPDFTPVYTFKTTFSPVNLEKDTEINFESGFKFKIEHLEKESNITLFETILKFPKTEYKIPKTEYKKLYESKYLPLKFEIVEISINLCLGKSGSSTKIAFFTTRPEDEYVKLDFEYDAKSDQYIIRAPRKLLTFPEKTNKWSTAQDKVSHDATAFIADKAYLEVGVKVERR